MEPLKSRLEYCEKKVFLHGEEYLQFKSLLQLVTKEKCEYLYQNVWSKGELTPIDALEKLIDKRDKFRGTWRPKEFKDHLPHSAVPYKIFHDLTFSELFEFSTSEQANQFDEDNHELFEILSNIYTFHFPSSKLEKQLKEIKALLFNTDSKYFLEAETIIQTLELRKYRPANGEVWNLEKITPYEALYDLIQRKNEFNAYWKPSRYCCKIYILQWYKDEYNQPDFRISNFDYDTYFHCNLFTFEKEEDTKYFQKKYEYLLRRLTELFS